MKMAGSSMELRDTYGSARAMRLIEPERNTSTLSPFLLIFDVSTYVSVA
jgi:hypothetical protein